ncbi:MAG: hypothetical protein H8D22_08760 [Candidatus Cloacimonetes bacterium]|nr:hypothetical protein [Candidatus Cloacimonadota bacterium]
MTKKLPEFLRTYFWDVDFDKLDMDAYPKYVLSRILEYGNEKAVRWMKKNYTKDDVADVLFRLRSVSPKSANFWSVIYDIDRKKVLCLQKHYLEIRKMHWPY